MQKNRYKTRHKAARHSAKQRRNKKMLEDVRDTISRVVPHLPEEPGMALRCVVLVRSQKRLQK